VLCGFDKDHSFDVTLLELMKAASNQHSGQKPGQEDTSIIPGQSHLGYQAHFRALMGPFCSCCIDKSSEYGPESGLDLPIQAERVGQMQLP
jgi:hypothetical protein